MQIRDRVILGIVAGLAGNLVKTGIDEISLRLRISQRSFRSTAAGVWVSTKKEAQNPKGQALGAVLDMGMGSLGGVGIVGLLTKTGKDHTLAKGLLSGLSIGAAISATLSAFPTNKVRPKDSASNLSYSVAHGVYGIVTAVVASKLGHPSLFDVKPMNDYLEPTELTTEQRQVGASGPPVIGIEQDYYEAPSSSIKTESGLESGAPNSF